jgi:DNA invertase Pin-like site-specific DNA recombinase
MKPAAQYLRMSTDRQRYSLASQSAAIADYATANGFQIVATYEDKAKSGVTIAKRDALKSLLSDIMADPPFSAVLVFDVSRWGRYQDPDQAAHYEFICREAGVAVRYCAEPFADDGSPTAALIKSIKRVMAAEYSRQLSDRCRASLRRHMLAGGKCGGHPPYGFARQIFENDGTPGRVLDVGDRRGPGQIVRLVHGPADEVANVRRIFRLSFATCSVQRRLLIVSMPRPYPIADLGLGTKAGSNTF